MNIFFLHNAYPCLLPLFSQLLLFKKLFLRFDYSRTSLQRMSYLFLIISFPFSTEFILPRIYPSQHTLVLFLKIIFSLFHIVLDSLWSPSLWCPSLWYLSYLWYDIYYAIDIIPYQSMAIMIISYYNSCLCLPTTHSVHMLFYIVFCLIR